MLLESDAKKKPPREMRVEGRRREPHRLTLALAQGPETPPMSLPRDEMRFSVFSFLLLLLVREAEGAEAKPTSEDKHSG